MGRAFWLLSCVLVIAGCAAESSGPLPALSPPVSGKADENGLVTQIRPRLARVAEGDPLPIVLHFDGARGPLTPAINISVSLRDSVDSLTFHVTNPDGKKLDLKPQARENKKGDHPADLSTAATMFLDLTATGFSVSPREDSGTWQDGPVPALEKTGKYSISVSGNLMPGEANKGKPISFASGTVEVERVADYLPIDEIRSRARNKVKSKLQAGHEEGGYVYDDADGNRLVHMIGPSSEMWHYKTHTVQLDPQGKVLNVYSREVSNCLAEGTRLDGEAGRVNIEDVRVGDRVWGYDLARKERVLTIVRAVRHADVGQTLRLACGLRLTGEHPVYADGRWVLASELRESDELLAEDKAVHVGKIERVVGRVAVYDVTVDEPHNFFAQGVLVHNKSRAFTPKLDDLWYRLWSPD